VPSSSEADEGLLQFNSETTERIAPAYPHIRQPFGLPPSPKGEGFSLSYTQIKEKLTREEPCWFLTGLSFVIYNL